MATVLVVDDAADVRDLTKSLLQLVGHQPLVLPSDQDTIEVAAEFRPGIIVLNVEATDEDAWSTLKQLKKDPRTSGIPVVVSSDFVTDDYFIRAHQFGAQGVERKPLDGPKFLETLDQFITPAHLAQAS